LPWTLRPFSWVQEQFKRQSTICPDWSRLTLSLVISLRWLVLWRQIYFYLPIFLDGGDAAREKMLSFQFPTTNRAVMSDGLLLFYSLLGMLEGWICIFSTVAGNMY
jgi:hypothetical protein